MQFRGVSASQDLFFGNKDESLKAKTKLLPALQIQIDTNRINLDLLRPWMEERLIF